MSAVPILTDFAILGVKGTISHLQPWLHVYAGDSRFLTMTEQNKINGCSSVCDEMSCFIANQQMVSFTDIAQI